VACSQVSSDRDHRNLEESGSLSGKKQEDEVRVFPGATFECVRCGTRISGEELASLPEPTCSNCGYRIFRKVRGSTVKTMKGE
jgi:DNA-directed RNA polymerase subunit RPC12/RpoP